MYNLCVNIDNGVVYALHFLLSCCWSTVRFNLYMIYLPCAPINRYIYSLLCHAQHNQQFSWLLVSTYIKAIIRPTYDLELMKKLHSIPHINMGKRAHSFNIYRCFIMYSGITKIVYRKTAGHVFMKLVQIEGTTKKFFPSKLFFIVVHISAARWCECM